MLVFSPERLRAIRIKRGLVPEHVAIDVEVTAQSVRHWECGYRTPSAHVIGKLADALKCSPADFYEKAGR